MRKMAGFVLALVLGALAGLVCALALNFDAVSGLLTGAVAAAVALLTFGVTPALMSHQAEAHRREDLRRDIARDMERDAERH